MGVGKEFNNVQVPKQCGTPNIFHNNHMMHFQPWAMGIIHHFNLRYP